MTTHTTPCDCGEGYRPAPEATGKPGSTIIALGLAAAVFGLFLTILGATPALVLVPAGLVVAAIGFGRRVLAALEARP